MNPRLSGHFSIFGLLFFELKSLLGIVRQWRRVKSAILTVTPRSHVRILIYRTRAINLNDSFDSSPLYISSYVYFHVHHFLISKYPLFLVDIL